MTQDEIIRMAREAGFLKDEIYEDVYEGNALDFERFANLVAEAERAKIALAYRTRPRGKSEAPHMIAAYRAMQMALGAMLTAQNTLIFKCGGDMRPMERQTIDDLVEAITLVQIALAQPTVKDSLTAQTQGEWVDLRDVEIGYIYDDVSRTVEQEPMLIRYAKAIIAKFKEKNTPPSVEAVVKALRWAVDNPEDNAYWVLQATEALKPFEKK